MALFVLVLRAAGVVLGVHSLCIVWTWIIWDISIGWLPIFRTIRTLGWSLIRALLVLAHMRLRVLHLDGLELSIYYCVSLWRSAGEEHPKKKKSSKKKSNFSQCHLRLLSDLFLLLWAHIFIKRLILLITEVSFLSSVSHSWCKSPKSPGWIVLSSRTLIW